MKHIYTADSKRSLFYNLRLSHRGAIRRAPNAVAWCESLCKQSTSDPLTLVRAWNDDAQTAPGDRIIGLKSAAVKQLLSTQIEIRERVLQIVGQAGWDNCPFTDDNLASKKVWPGGTHRAGRTPKTSPWHRRGNVTVVSCMLHLQSYCGQHMGTKPKKLDKLTFEHASELFALACCLAEEVSTSVSIPLAILQQESGLLVCAKTL